MLGYTVSQTSTITTMDLNELFKNYNKEATTVPTDLKNRKPMMIVKTTEKLYNSGVKAKKENNFKQAYIHLTRWIYCVNYLSKRKIDDETIEKYFSTNKIANVKNFIEEVKRRIAIEYETKQKQAEISNNSATEAKDLAINEDAVISLQFPDTPDDEPQPKDKNEISCSELFAILSRDIKNNENTVLIIDVRREKEYNESRLSFEENMINIPADWIEPKKRPDDYYHLLDNESENKFRKRSSKYTTIVLLDTDSSSDTMKNTSPIATFKKCLEDKDSFSEFKKLVILKGGFNEWKNVYSTYVTTPSLETPNKNDYSSGTLNNSEFPASPILSANYRCGVIVKPLASNSQTSIRSNTNSLNNDSQIRSLIHQTPSQIKGSLYSSKFNDLVNSNINNSDQQLLRKNNIRESTVVLEKMRPPVDRSNKPGHLNKRPQPNLIDEKKESLKKEIEETRVSLSHLERKIDIEKVQDPWVSEEYKMLLKREEDLLTELTHSIPTKLYPSLHDFATMSLGPSTRASSTQKVNLRNEKENTLVHQPLLKIKPMQPPPAPSKPTVYSVPQEMEVDEDESNYKEPLKSEDPPMNSGLKRSHSSPNLMQNKEVRKETPEFDRSLKPKGIMENEKDLTNSYVIMSQTIIPSRSHKDRETRMEPIYASSVVHPGITGLKNLGNSCYMNSIIQCLSNTAYLAQYFTSNTYTDDLNKNGAKNPNVAEEVAQVIKALWRGLYKSISPRDLKVVVGQYKLQFESYDQQDSHEFLMFLLDWMHNDLKRKNKTSYHRPLTTAEKEWEKSMDGQTSIISQLFFGQLRSTIECRECKKHSTTYETFNSLTMSLPASNKCTLDDCVKKFVSGQSVSGWKCPNCKVPREGLKKFDFAKLPHIIVIHLNRFGDTGGWLEKKNTAVEFPLNNFDLRKYLVPDNQSDDEVYSTTYNLYAMSNHYGTMDGGHYTAYCKSTPLHKWYKYDDHTVSEVAQNTVKNQSNSAYLLFYAMVSTESLINS